MSDTINSDSVAQDQIRAFVDRILRMKEEAKAINADIREIYAEAKGNGFDKTVLGKLVSYVEKRNSGAADLQEAEALFDLYLSAYDDASHTHAPARTREAEATAAGADIETGEIIEDKIEPSGNSGEFNSAPTDAPAGSMADSDGGVDATTVAPIQPKAAAQNTPRGEPGTAREAPGGQPLPGDGDIGGLKQAAEPAPRTINEATDKPVGASLQNMQETPAAPLYAAPGIIVMEKCPPRGIVAHPYAACWPVNKIDVHGGVREPIIKIEHFILDGRGRYFAAREAGIEYPVVQYDGADPLLDCIRWNLASRTIAGEPKRIVAHKLCKLEPDRADAIMSAMGLAEERAAAE